MLNTCRDQNEGGNRSEGEKGLLCDPVVDREEAGVVGRLVS